MVARQLIARLEVLPTKRVLVLMVGVFGLVHLGYYLAGVRFDVVPLVRFFQFLDPELLRHRLAESLFYLHSQPPLFNLFLGIVLKLFPGHEAIAFHTTYLALGLVLYLALFTLMRRLGISRIVALALSTWFIVSPSFVLYEHWLFYTLPLAVVLTLSVLLFHQVLEARTAWAALGFFTSLFLLSGIHSMFHLAYCLVAMGAVLVLCRGQRRMILLTAAFPLLLIASLPTKNLVLFGEFATSSWAGMNLSGPTLRAVPIEERERLVAAGKLSRLALIPRFARLTSYPQEYVRVRGFEGIPALRQVRKSTGFGNYNHLAYVAISRQYLKDDLHVLLHYPKYALAGWLNAWLHYFRSTSDYGFFYGNLAKIVPVNVLYDYLFYGKVPRCRVQLDDLPIHYAPYRESRLYVFLLIGLPLLLVLGFRTALRERRTGLSLDRDQRMLLLYLCLNVAFVAVVGNILEVGENQRFRFATDPLDVVLLGLLVEQLRRRRGPVQGTGVTDTGRQPAEGRESRVTPQGCAVAAQPALD